MDPNKFDAIVKLFSCRSGAALARELGRSRKSASRWRKDGFPPKVRLELLDLAPKRGIKLSHQDFNGA